MKMALFWVVASARLHGAATQKTAIFIDIISQWQYLKARSLTFYDGNVFGLPSSRKLVT
jgi:hypothetical protein